MSTHQNEIIAEHIHENNCEYDCKYVCMGCEKTFCDIKTEENCKHHEELTDTYHLNCGSRYCSDHCYPY